MATEKSLKQSGSAEQRSGTATEETQTKKLVLAVFESSQRHSSGHFYLNVLTLKDHTALLKVHSEIPGLRQTSPLSPGED